MSPKSEYVYETWWREITPLICYQHAVQDRRSESSIHWRVLCIDLHWPFDPKTPFASISNSIKSESLSHVLQSSVIFVTAALISQGVASTMTITAEGNVTSRASVVVKVHVYTDPLRPVYMCRSMSPPPIGETVHFSACSEACTQFERVNVNVRRRRRRGFE